VVEAVGGGDEVHTVKAVGGGASEEARRGSWAGRVRWV